MAAIILIPALACWATLAMGSARKALLWVYLPATASAAAVLRSPPASSAPDQFCRMPPILPLGIALMSRGRGNGAGVDGSVGVAVSPSAPDFQRRSAPNLGKRRLDATVLAGLRGVAAAQHQHRGWRPDVRCGGFDNGASLHGRASCSSSRKAMRCASNSSRASSRCWLWSRD